MEDLKEWHHDFICWLHDYGYCLEYRTPKMIEEDEEYEQHKVDKKERRAGKKKRKEELEEKRANKKAYKEERKALLYRMVQMVYLEHSSKYCFDLFDDSPEANLMMSEE